jgi:hypothetical protein
MKRITNKFREMPNRCPQTNRESVTQHRTFDTRLRIKTPLPTPHSPLPYLLFIICYLFFSCKSAVQVTEQTLLESGMVPLNAGAAAYAIIDVPHSRPILEGISFIPVNDRNVKMMLDRTRSAVLAVFSPTPADDRRYQLVSWGSYPASGSSIAFGSSKDWTKQRSASLNTVYWHSEISQMSIAVSPAQAYVLVAMTKIPHDPIASSEGVKIPEGFGEFAKGAVFSCWLSNPGPVLNQRIKEMNIPLEIPAEQLFIRVFSTDDQAPASQPASAKQPSSANQTMYEAHIKITLPSATQARPIVSFLALARAFMPPAQPSISQDGGAQDSAAMSSALLSALLFANPVVQEGASLLLKSPRLSMQEISLLFSMFSL